MLDLISVAITYLLGASFLCGLGGFWCLEVIQLYITTNTMLIIIFKNSNVRVDVWDHIHNDCKTIKDGYIMVVNHKEFVFLITNMYNFIKLITGDKSLTMYLILMLYGVFSYTTIGNLPTFLC